MRTMANWHVGDLGGTSDADPFADEEALPVEQVGTPIDLSDSIASLSKELQTLMWRECELFNVGLTCAIKDRDDTACSACPVSKHADPQDPLAPLCLVGRDQERVVTTLAVKRGG